MDGAEAPCAPHPFSPPRALRRSVSADADRPRVIAVAVVERDGRFLVQRREEEPFQGLWEFPGGKLERGESLEEAARRECREERGLDVDVLGLLDVFAHAYPPPGPHVVLVCYLARPRSGSEPRGGRWVTLSELRSIEMLPANSRLVERLVARQGP